MDIRDYVEHLRAKSVHQRQNIAFASAGCITILVAFGWLTTLVSSGVFAFKESETDAGFVSATQVLQSQTAKLLGPQGGANLAGAAGAFGGIMESAEVTVVDTKASSTLDREDIGEATVIPF